MNIHIDFEEFLKFLKDENVEFVIIGGYAVAFHGYVRATNDMDLFFRTTEKNIVRIRKALKRFGLQTTAKQAKEFIEPGSIIRMGLPPVRLEMINNISGLTFDEVWKHRISGEYGAVAVNYMSLKDLLKNKKASGRPKDLADFDELGGNRK
jgi:predicted nucleotidyltransferase